MSADDIEARLAAQNSHMQTVQRENADLKKKLAEAQAGRIAMHTALGEVLEAIDAVESEPGVRAPIFKVDWLETMKLVRELPDVTCLDQFVEAAIRSSAPALVAERLTKLTEFKAFVHGHLDAHGVPADPDPIANAQHGCRIEGRLNHLLAQRDGAREQTLDDVDEAICKSVDGLWQERKWKLDPGLAHAREAVASLRSPVLDATGKASP